MIRVTISCDSKVACGGWSGPLDGVGPSVDEAYAHALKNARRDGWSKRQFASLNGRLGWVCPDCRRKLNDERGNS